MSLLLDVTDLDAIAHSLIQRLSKPDKRSTELRTGKVGATAHDRQGLLCPTQYTQPWALRRMNRCPGQVVSLTRNPRVKSQANLILILSTHRRDERLSQPCPAQGLNLGPVVWKRDALTTQPLGF
ncbi:hypothetical protein TNCV_298761 [Trichonephila clavipes]|nr:hypothetical protein TNCV_298761 [Trichonephila clavipes]